MVCFVFWTEARDADSDGVDDAIDNDDDNDGIPDIDDPDDDNDGILDLGILLTLINLSYYCVTVQRMMTGWAMMRCRAGHPVHLL